MMSSMSRHYEFQNAHTSFLGQTDADWSYMKYVLDPLIKPVS
jgi:hypothetical protein